jgi:hypothetical protein
VSFMRCNSDYAPTLAVPIPLSIRAGRR